MKIVLKYTTHEYPQIRKEAVRILAGKNPAIAERLILNELSSADPQTVLQFCELAEETHNTKILQQLHRHLQPLPQDDEELEMKKQLLQTLGKIGHQSSKALMQNLLTVGGMFRPRRQKEFQAEIKKVLQAFGQS